MKKMDDTACQKNENKNKKQFRIAISIIAERHVCLGRVLTKFITSGIVDHSHQGQSATLSFSHLQLTNAKLRRPIHCIAHKTTLSTLSLSR